MMETPPARSATKGRPDRCTSEPTVTDGRELCFNLAPAAGAASLPLVSMDGLLAVETFTPGPQMRKVQAAVEAAASAPGITSPGSKRCVNYGVTCTPACRSAVPEGPDELCNAVGLKQETSQSMQEASPESKPPTTPAKAPTPRATTQAPPRVPVLDAAAPEAAPAPLARTPTSRPLRVAPKAASQGLSALNDAEAEAALAMTQVAAMTTGDEAGCSTPTRSRSAHFHNRAHPEAPDVENMCVTLSQPKSKYAREPTAECQPAETRRSLCSPGFRTPTPRRTAAQRLICSPASSQHARDLLFLSQNHTAPQQRQVQRKTGQAPKTAPKTAPPGAAPPSTISERNRAAALARWRQTPNSGAATGTPACRKCGLLGATAGSSMCAACGGGGVRKRKMSFSSPRGAPEDLPSSPPRFSDTLPATSDAAGDDDEDEDFAPRLAAAPRAKKQRRVPAAKAEDRKGGVKRSQSGEAPSRSGSGVEWLPGQYTHVDKITVHIPGVMPFHLARLSGAPHGQPAVALRQVQVALVPHTDRTSAFYLAMQKAADKVKGNARPANRPEMSLLVSAGALAKGACRASIGTFPAVAAGLKRLGVDANTIAILMQHDVRESLQEPPAAAPPAADGASPAPEMSDAAPDTLGAAAEAAGAAAQLEVAARGVTAAAQASAASHRKRASRRPRAQAAAQAASVPGASPDHGASAESADTAVAADAAWGAPPRSTAATSRPSRSAGRPRRLSSPEPMQDPFSDGGSSGRSKRARTDLGSQTLGDANRIHAEWLPLLQQPPTAAMRAAALVLLERRQTQQPAAAAQQPAAAAQQPLERLEGANELLQVLSPRGGSGAAALCSPDGADATTPERDGSGGASPEQEEAATAMRMPPGSSAAGGHCGTRHPAPLVGQEVSEDEDEDALHSQDPFAVLLKGKAAAGVASPLQQENVAPSRQVTTGASHLMAF